MTTNTNEESPIDQKKYELLLFLQEKNKRKKQKILWQNHPELVDKNKLYYTDQDKALIKQPSL